MVLSLRAFVLECISPRGGPEVEVCVLGAID